MATANSPDGPLRLDHLRIVLVEPAGALNVGSIARVMKNLGFSQLVLVKPHCDPLGEEARQMAVHAADVLEQAQRVETLPDALVGCQQAVATTARDRANRPLYGPEVGLARLLPSRMGAGDDLRANVGTNVGANPRAGGAADKTAAESDWGASGVPPAALIFGPEDRGLSNDELAYAQCGIKIPTHPAYPSLNLAQAVAICCYELSRLACRPAPATPPAIAPELPQPEQAIASLDQLEGLYQHLESTLLTIGYLYPHTAGSRMEKFRTLGHRAQLSAQEVTMLRGILRQVKWFADVGGDRPPERPSDAD